MKPYSIRTPNFEICSGGIRVMYGLYGHLLARGQVAFLNSKLPETEFVGIYPDIYEGNDMEATKVVRYMLNFPGTMGRFNPTTGLYDAGQIKFGKNDDIYFFSRVFDTIGVDDDHILFLPILNLHIFKDQKRKRTKNAVFFGKGEHLDTTRHPEGCVALDRAKCNDQQALADLLNECQTIYIYDQVTAMTELSRLCGTRVVVFPYEITKEQFSVYEPGLNGISWEKDEGNKLDVKDFRKHYEDMIKTFEIRLEHFIERTQK